MYLLAEFPPLIPILMYVPVLFALYVDKKNIDHPITLNLNGLSLSLFVGSLAYLLYAYFLVNIAGLEVDIFDWKFVQISGVILPILFGGIFLYIKLRNQIKFLNVSTGGIVAGIFFLLFTCAPFLYIWNLGTNPLTILVFPVLFGLWLVLNMSNYSWKYYLSYTILSLFSSFLFLLVLWGLS